MPRELPPNAAALRAQAAAPAPSGPEPDDANPVELAFEVADDIALSLRSIACAVSSLALSSVPHVVADEAATVGEIERRAAALTLAQAAAALASSMLGDVDMPAAPDKPTQAAGVELP